MAFFFISKVILKIFSYRWQLHILEVHHQTQVIAISQKLTVCAKENAPTFRSVKISNFLFELFLFQSINALAHVLPAWSF